MSSQSATVVARTALVDRVEGPLWPTEELKNACSSQDAIRAHIRGLATNSTATRILPQCRSERIRSDRVAVRRSHLIVATRVQEPQKFNAGLRQAGQATQDRPHFDLVRLDAGVGRSRPTRALRLHLSRFSRSSSRDRALEGPLRSESARGVGQSSPAPHRSEFPKHLRFRELCGDDPRWRAAC